MGLLGKGETLSGSRLSRRMKALTQCAIIKHLQQPEMGLSIIGGLDGGVPGHSLVEKGLIWSREAGACAGEPRPIKKETKEGTVRVSHVRSIRTVRVSHA